MSELFEVERVLWSGNQGGAIFSGRGPEGKSTKIVAKADAMPRPPLLGEAWRISGSFSDHPEHGRQLNVITAVLERPTGAMIIGFLRGQNCPGIGPVLAKRLYEVFGTGLYELLDGGDPSALLPVVGLDVARTAMTSWADHALETKTHRWLDAHGLPPRFAKKLAAIYGNSLPEKAEENPFRLLAFFPWVQLDALARSTGMSSVDPRRLVAAVEAVVYERLDEGHTVTRWADLGPKVMKLLNCSRSITDDALDSAAIDNAVEIRGDIVAGIGSAAMERYLSDQLVKRLEGSGQISFAAAATSEELLEEILAIEDVSGFELNDDQRKAVIVGVREPFSILTGGAGTGKTTALRAIHEICDRHLTPVFQVALAGRAAQRMASATGRPAMTIAGFLNRIDQGIIEEGSLSGSLLIVDEASMLDLSLAYRMVRRLPVDARIMLVGDPGQLPPIGFGLVLHALTDGHPALPHISLSQIHRQAESTGIPTASISVREGKVPSFSPYSGPCPGISFLDCELSAVPLELLRLRDELGEDETQIIASLRGGVAGTVGINQLFHSLTGNSTDDAGPFSKGEPVIWTQNDYDLELMNGSLGLITAVGSGGLVIDFEGSEKEIPTSRFSSLEHAYAITVHKAQGSQFRRIILPVVSGRLLDRAMLYTAITRAQEQVVLIGDRNAFADAVTTIGISDRRDIGLRAEIGSRLAAMGANRA